MSVIGRVALTTASSCPASVPGIHVVIGELEVVDGRDEPGHDGGLCDHDLKKLFAASLEARFFVAAACKRSISEVSSAIRSLSS